MSLGGSKGSSRESRSVDIPAFLQPFIRQSASTAGRALRGIERLGPENLVSPLTEDQEAALSLARERAGGAGGFIPTAQSELLRTAQGVPISDFLPEDTLASLSGFGGDAFSPDIVARLMTTGVLPESSIQTLTGAQGAGLPVGSQALNVDPRISSFLPAASQDTLTRLTQQRGIGETPTIDLPPESLAALQSTAQGDFLFGGEGFDRAVDAAVRSALPQIRSVFGSAGAGGATGGLAQTAVGQAAIDAFASQFGAERGRQLSAADRLAGLSLDAQGLGLSAQDQFERQKLAGDQLAFGAADVLANLGLAGRGQSIDAGGLLAGIDLSNRAQQQDAASTLANLGLLENEQGIRGAGILGDLISGEQQRELSASGLLADIANTERGRSLTAAGLLPDAALLDVNLLDQVGSARQEQAEREARAPLDFNQLLLTAALGGLPIESLLGQTATSRRRGFGFDLPFNLFEFGSK